MKQDYKGHVKTNHGPNKLGVKKDGKGEARRHVRHKANSKVRKNEKLSTSGTC